MKNLNESTIRASQPRDILEKIQEANCSSVSQVLDMLDLIWEEHYGEIVELENKAWLLPKRPV